MRSIASAVAATALIVGALMTAQPAHAAQITHDTNVYTQPVAPRTPAIEPLDCHGGTGTHGCGAGWVWRDGWRGWACYPC